MYEIRRRIAIGTRNGQRSASSDYDTGTDLDCADIGHQVEIDDGDPDGLDARWRRNRLRGVPTLSPLRLLTRRRRKLAERPGDLPRRVFVRRELSSGFQSNACDLRSEIRVDSKVTGVVQLKGEFS